LNVETREKNFLIILVETSSPVLSLNSFLGRSADSLNNICLCSKFKRFGRPLRGWLLFVLLLFQENQASCICSFL